MNRDDLLETGLRAAYGDYYTDPVDSDRIARVLDAVEPMIRGDERAKHGASFNAHINKVAGMVRADLRTKIKTLLDDAALRTSDAYDQGIRAGLRDALALIDGNKS